MVIKNDFEWTKHAGKFLSTKEHILLTVGEQHSTLNDFSVDLIGYLVFRFQPLYSVGNKIVLYL